MIYSENAVKSEHTIALTTQLKRIILASASAFLASTSASQSMIGFIRLDAGDESKPVCWNPRPWQCRGVNTGLDLRRFIGCGSWFCATITGTLRKRFEQDLGTYSMPSYKENLA